MTLLQQMDAERYRRREDLRDDVRQRLHAALTELGPVQKVTVFGSLAKPGRFSETSDVGVALWTEPAGDDY